VQKRYGINVAKLADLPIEILHGASQKAKELEQTIIQHMIF
jgi:DNA mismatch repair ATPase MutS